MKGRPTVFKEEMIQQARDYINGGYIEHEDMIPSILGIAKLLNVSKSSLYLWAEDKEHPFSDILEECNAEQCRTLINKGLSSEFNSNITKLVLGKHGYAEKTDNKNTDTVNVNFDCKDSETI